MKLKKIEIIGFKSFADKTVLLFHPGITAVVGPNGCGKSNISDAFRWVLGEQSAKSMRGSKMYDIIFAGTSERKPLNFAEVTITMTDVSGFLPTEYEEVSVTRRLHRSGESEYLINRRPVRLKDVYDLFLDTGIGKNAFSIFEQGKIEQVINLPPLERRYIFEEAAGILRFLQRKREALRKLQQTEQNIERVKDIHQEVERQIIVLEQQAEKARLFKEHRAELETLEIGLFCARWDLFERRITLAKEKGEGKQQEIAQETEGLEKLELERQNANICFREAEKELQLQKDKVFQTRSDKEIKTKEWENSEERLCEMVIKEQEWCRELGEMIEKRNKRQEEKERAAKQQEELESALSGIEEVRRTQLENVRLLEVEVNTARNLQHDTQKQLLELLQKENQVESERKQTTLRLEHLNEKKQRMMDRQEILAQEVQKLQEAIEDKKQAIDLRGEAVIKLKETVEVSDKQIEGVTEEIQATQETLDALYQEKAEFKARQNVLFRLRDEMEGFSQGTKKLLQESSREASPLFGKIRGLFEAISPKEGGEMPLSVVMRPYIQTLVVESEQDIDAVARFAKENGIKDFSLISSDQLITSSETFSDLPSLLTKVQDSHFARHFLNSVFLGGSRKEAVKVVKAVPGAKVWAEEGIFIDSNGVTFFTSEGEENVFLREAELKTLEKKLHKLETLRAKLEEALKGFIQKRNDFHGQKKEEEQKLRHEEMKVVEETYSLKRLEADREKAAHNLENEKTEILSIDQHLDELKRLLADLDLSLNDAKVKAQEVQRTVDSLSCECEEKLAVLKEEQSRLQEKEAAFHKISDEKKHLVHMLNVFEVKDLESLQQEARLEREVKKIQEKQSEIKLLRAGFEEQIAEMDSHLTKVFEECRGLEEVVNKRRDDIEKVEAAIACRRDALKTKESELHEFSIQLAELNSSSQALETELQERLHLTIQEAKSRGVTLENGIEKTEKQIRSLRRKMEDAGDINMTSIEEFDKHKERYEFLNHQIDDLTASKDKLVEIITELDTESRKIFKETFELIRENFKKNFQILFRGGESDLRFTENADILEAGIEIVAKPPGKQMRSINLLSGGEKCLTAVALLFAIFEVKPAPFCILDEIDAPLDDTNVERFVNVVKQFTDQCQFIIITHNKRTMAIADILFGVSMQEKGVSKLLKMEFSPEKEPEPVLV